MSSDSEDDCYGNIAQKLQRLKNNYVVDNIESTDLLNETKDSVDDTKEIDEIVNKAKISAKPRKNVQNEPSTHTDGTTGRVTRSSSRKLSSNSDSIIEVETSTTTIKSGGKRGRGRSKRKCSPSLDVSSPPNQRGTRRKRGRGRGGNRNSIIDLLANCLQPDIPTYSVGNTEEYPDQSDSQALFNTNETNDVILIEDTIENEELSVKVYWQSSELFKFSIRKYQKLSQIFDYFANKESVSQERLLFTYNDKILKVTDTPDSIDYNIAKFIDGGVVKHSVVSLQSDREELTNGIRLKFQCQNVKKPFETTVRRSDTLTLAMVKCAEHLEKPLDKLKFLFDGDYITGTLTAAELELEGGECIDVKILS